MGHVTRAFIHSFLSSSLNPAPNKQPHTRYVLIVKRPVGRPRSITNFDDVLVAVGKVLSPGGVEAVVHTGGKLLDQLAHFGGALGVLGPHGAGLSLILAMEPGRYVFACMDVNAACVSSQPYSRIGNHEATPTCTHTSFTLLFMSNHEATPTCTHTSFTLLFMSDHEATPTCTHTSFTLLFMSVTCENVRTWQA
jgi:hypothetical protein